MPLTIAQRRSVGSVDGPRASSSVPDLSGYDPMKTANIKDKDIPNKPVPQGQQQQQPLQVPPQQPLQVPPQQHISSRRSSTIKSALSSFLNGPTTEQQATPSGNGTARRYSTNSMNNHSSTSTAGSHVSGGVVVNPHSLPRSHTTPQQFTRSKDPSTPSLLEQVLLSRGFVNPKRVIHNNNSSISISVATTGQYVFLPTISSNDDEYLMRLNGLNDDAMDDQETEFLIESMARDQHNSSAAATANNHNNSNSNNNSTPTLGDDNGEENTSIDGSMAPFNIAVIISVRDGDDIRWDHSIHLELCARLKLYWNNGVPPTKTFNEEFYKIVSCQWDIDPTKSNSKYHSIYIPSNVDSVHSIIEHSPSESKNTMVNMLDSSLRKYIDKTKTKQDFVQSIRKTHKGKTLPNGDYIFILPCVFTNHIPETLYYPSARVTYSLKVGTIQQQQQTQALLSSSSSLSSSHQEHAPITSPSSTISLSKTELEKSQPKKLIKNSIFKKMKNTLHHKSSNSSASPDSLTTNQLYGEYPIKVIRTPPPISVSTANKPIYINRIWTDSLSYEISFATKYVSLNSDVPIKIKLAPLQKNICVKRIRCSINEKITFVSKGLEYEYDQVDPVAKDPYNPYYLDFQAKRRKERNLALLEIRTKEKGARALREEIVENTTGDNLISYSTVPNDSSSNSNKKRHDNDQIEITEPITIETVLSFPKFQDFDKKRVKVIPPYGIDSFQMIPNPEIVHANAVRDAHRPSVINILTGNHHSHHYATSLHSTGSGSNDEDGGGGLSPSDDHDFRDDRFYQTKIRTNSGIPVKYHTKLNESKRGLYLDSMHFSNIHSRHKLEIMLRISKPDPQDSTRLRHYEVLIDTPIFLVSEICNSGNMELPTYHMAMGDNMDSIVSETIVNGSNINDPFDPILPPSFEEAISVPNSPICSPIGSPSMLASYDPDNLYIQQLTLSRATSISGPSSTNMRGSTTNTNGLPLGNNNSTSSVNETPTSLENENMFNNLDNLLTSQPSIFKKNYKINEGVIVQNNGHSDVETLSDPPNYDEATNNP